MQLRACLANSALQRNHSPMHFVAPAVVTLCSCKCAYGFPSSEVADLVACCVIFEHVVVSCKLIRCISVYAVHEHAASSS